MAQKDKSEYDFDVFISHASEDKDAVVRPLAKQLNILGLDVWYDEFELELGDSLRGTIDGGLKGSNYGIVIFSDSFFGKDWSEYELDGLVQRQMSEDKVILPLWYGVNHPDIVEYSPSLANLKAIEVSQDNIQDVVSEIYSLVQREPEEVAEDWQENKETDSTSTTTFRSVDIRFEEYIDVDKAQKITLESWRNHGTADISGLEAVEIYEEEKEITHSSNTKGTIMSIDTIKNHPLTGMVSDIRSMSSGKTEFTMWIEESQLESLPNDRSFYRSRY